MATYKIDPAHSQIYFKVKHLMITSVTGYFSKFNASLKSDKDDFSDASVTFEADVNSISTNQEQRDTHLKSDDFFAADQYPKLRFTSTKIEKQGDKNYKLSGNLTIRNITKPVNFDVDYLGTVTDSYGQTKAGFEISGKINRKEFGLKWDAVTETGGIVVSDNVQIVADVQMIKQP